MVNVHEIWSAPQSSKSKKHGAVEKNQIARGQKCGQETTVRKPAIRPMEEDDAFTEAFRDTQPMSSGQSLTNIHTSSDKTRVSTPTATKDIRHPIAPESRTSGVAADKEPIPPMAIRIPVIGANSTGVNHSDSIFMVGTKSMATPTPTSKRPAIAIAADEANPSRTEPTKATRKKTVIVLRGPQESESSPAGSCMAA